MTEFKTSDEISLWRLPFFCFWYQIKLKCESLSFKL